MSETANDFFLHISRELARGRTVAVAVVIRRHGSGPREPGAKMTIDSDGRVWGTVGGGELEHRVMERARYVLRTGRPERVEFEMRNEDAAAAGMMCGGWVEVLVDRLRPDDPHVNHLIVGADAALASRQSFVLVISLSGEGLSLHAIWDLVVGGRSVMATSYPTDLSAAWATPPMTDGLPECRTSDGGSVYLEWVLPPEVVYIFGAGHIGVELVPLCRRAGFRTVVLDDRTDYADAVRLPDAHEIVVLDSFIGCMDGLPIDDRSFIVIVTRGHLHDREVLEQALRTGARYVGMIGSARKKSTLFTALAASGFTPDELDQVRCPIGLTIGAETPAEIALCIAAELVAVRRGVLPSRRLS